MKRMGYVFLPEGIKSRVVYGTEKELRQGRIVCDYRGIDKESQRAYGVKFKVEMAPPARFKDVNYLTFGKPGLVTQKEHRRLIQLREWVGSRWREKPKTIDYRIGSKTLFWWS